MSKNGARFSACRSAPSCLARPSSSYSFPARCGRSTSSSPAIRSTKASRRPPRSHPLQPVTRTSVIVAPVAVATLAIRDALEANAPRGLTGKNENPLRRTARQGRHRLEHLARAVRGERRVDRAEHLDHAQRLAPRHRPDRQPGRQPHRRDRRPARQQARRRGAEARPPACSTSAPTSAATSMVTSRPALLPTWRIEPNLSGQVSLGDGGMQVAGIKLNVSERSEAAARQDRERADRQPVQQAPQRPHAGKRGAQAVDARCAARSRSARPPPARRTCGSRSSRPAPSRRSRKSSPTG